jgi:hypothetical protein
MIGRVSMVERRMVERPRPPKELMMQDSNGGDGTVPGRARTGRRRRHPAGQARLVAGVASASAMVGLVVGLANRPQAAAADPSSSTAPVGVATAGAGVTDPGSSAAGASVGGGSSTSTSAPTGRDDDGRGSWSDDDGSGSTGDDSASSAWAYSTPSTTTPPAAVPPATAVAPRAHTSSHGS